MDHLAHLLADVADLDVAAGGLAVLGQLDGATGDLGSLVADALQVDHRLGDADDQAQVGGRGLTASEDAQAFLVDAALHDVDLVVDGAHLARQPGIGIDHRAHGVADLLFHQTAHGQQVAADLFQFDVVLLGDVLRVAFFVDHAVSPA